MKKPTLLIYIYSSPQKDHVSLIQEYTHLIPNIKLIHFSKHELYEFPVKYYNIFTVWNFLLNGFFINLLQSANHLHWKFIQYIPLSRITFLKAINEKLNFSLLKLYIYLSSHSAIVLYNDFSIPIDKFIKSIKPKIIIGDCTESWTRNVAISSAKNATITLVNSGPMQKYLPDKCDPKLISAGYFRKQSLQDVHNKCFSVMRIKKSVMYLGSIDHRLNYDLILNSMKYLPDYSFHFLSDELFDYDQSHQSKEETLLNNKAYKMWKEVISLRNFSMTKTTSHMDVIHNIEPFSVGIIPYSLNTFFFQYVHPVKIYFYFAAGIPVVSTKMKTLCHYPSPYIKFYEDKSQFRELLTSQSRLKLSPDQKKDMLKISMKQTIEKKADDIISILDL